MSQTTVGALLDDPDATFWCGLLDCEGNELVAEGYQRQPFTGSSGVMFKALEDWPEVHSVAYYSSSEAGAAAFKLDAWAPKILLSGGVMTLMSTAIQLS